MKIRPVRAELFYVDGQTDMTKLIVAFRIFADALKTDFSISDMNNESRMADTVVLNSCVCS